MPTNDTKPSTPYFMLIAFLRLDTIVQTRNPSLSDAVWDKFIRP
jgi:hypothetical protein